MSDTLQEMKGRYNGCIMSVTATILPRAADLARFGVELSKTPVVVKGFEDYDVPLVDYVRIT